MAQPNVQLDCLTRSGTMHNKLNDSGKLVLRLTLGILILLHGIFKLTHGIGPIQGMVTGMGMPAFFAYGVYAGEVLGPLLLIIGFYARIGAALIAINMLFAFALAHTAELTSLTQNGGWTLELQGMFLFSAVALMLMGPGRIGINQQ
ncbi:MAG: DoxX family protein [Thiobacillus sp.]|nr:DoxX family protein [Thiobacillus sp.]